MKKKTIAALPFLLLVLGLSVFLSACDADCFDGSREAGLNFYRLNIERMTGTDTHTMQLKAGDMLEVCFKTEYGKLRMDIKASDGTLIYTGSGENTTDFTVNISRSGEYSVCVQAHNAKGNISIQKRR